MSTPEQVAADLNQLLTAAPAKPEEASSILLAGKAYLDQKILEEGQAPRLMETVKDDAGNVLIRKYEKLTKPFWQKYRSKPECRPLHFIHEAPLFVIDDVNCSFLLPEDFQFLGARFAQWGNDSVADQFFTEALKCGSADACINAGVFRFNRGERGVVDNFYVAKKHFNKALGVLHMMPLTVDEKHVRRKLCLEAIDEIDYRFASIFDKFIRFIIRLITFHFETIVNYIGPAAPKESADAKLKELTDGILKKEFEMKKAAAKKFLADLHPRIPGGHSHLESELAEIETEYGGFVTFEMLEIGVTRIGEFYSQNSDVLGLPSPSTGSSSGPIGQDEAGSPVEKSFDDICYELASFDEVEQVAMKFKLASMGEVMDLASRPVIDTATLAWLLRDRSNQKEIMERLASHSSVPAEIQQMIRRRYSFSEN